jgi:hypothetical protein
MPDRRSPGRQLDLPYPDFPENLEFARRLMDDPNPRWRDLYQAALLELDPKKLLQSIELAEQAIREQANRAPDLPRHNPNELQAMQDALRALSLLRRRALRE